MEGMDQMEVPGQKTTLFMASQLGHRRPASHQHVMLGTENLMAQICSAERTRSFLLEERKNEMFSLIDFFFLICIQSQNVL